MRPSELLALPFRYKPWRLRHARLIVRDLGRARARPQHSDIDHLHATIGWLCRAQDVRNGETDAGGVSAGWSFEDGWLPSYPETSGYIVETFIAAAKLLDRPALIQRAQRILDWELSLQQPDGAFPGHFGEPGSQPVIFNTGQIMHGMLAGYLQLGRAECLESALRAGHWLARHQDADGCWRTFEHHGVPHTYNTRGTWALLTTALVADDAGLKAAAIRNLDWALAQQRPSGWFAKNAFTLDREPFTHTIAYAIRGFLECGVLLGCERYVDAAVKAARAVAHVQRPDGWLAGTYGENWVAGARYCCLTGVAQMSLNWTRIAQEAGMTEMRDNARRAIAYIKGRQRLNDPDPVVRGAIAGSAPIWGRYSMFEFPNWAAKFFADALIMDLANVAVPPVPASARQERKTAAVSGASRATAGAGSTPTTSTLSRATKVAGTGLSVMILCGRSPRHLYVANRLCERARAVAIVQETGSHWSAGRILGQLKPGNVWRRAWRWLRDRRRYRGDGEARFFFGARTPELLRPDLRIEVPHINHPDVVALADRLQPDVIAVFGTSLIRGPLLGRGRLGIFNLHGGLSPRYRGADCTFWALYNGEPDQVGCTLHRIDAGIDTGSLIAHVRPEVNDGDDELTLFWRAVRDSADAYAELLERLARGETLGTPQREKGRLYQVKQRGWREERELARRLEKDLLRGVHLPRRVEWYATEKAKERASATA